MTDFTAYLRLGVDSRDAVTAQKDLDRMAAAGARSEKSFSAVSAASNRLKAALAGIGIVGATRQVLAYADAWTNVENVLTGVTNSQQELSVTQSKILQLSKDTFSSLDATAGLYAEITRSVSDLGVSQERVIGVTRTINNLFLAGGKSAQEASGAIRQLNQGLAAGALRGDEFNSVAEGAPRILDALSKSLKIGKGELRDFAATGGITAEILIGALEDYSNEAQRVVDITRRTFGQSAELARTFALEYVGASTAIKEFSADAGDVLVTFAKNLDLVADAVTALAVVVGARYVSAIGTKIAADAKALASTRAQAIADSEAALGAQRRAAIEASAAKAQLAKARADSVAATATVNAARANGTATMSVSELIVALNAQAVAQARTTAAVGATTAATEALNVANATLSRTNTAVAATGALATATRGLAGAMALLGGPAGVAIIAGAAIYHFATQASESEKIIEKLNLGVDGLVDRFNQLEAAGRSLAIDGITESIKEQKERVEDLKEELSGYQRILQENQNILASGAGGFVGASAESSIEIITKRITETQNKIDEARRNLKSFESDFNSIKLSDSEIKKIADSFGTLNELAGRFFDGNGVSKTFSMVPEGAAAEVEAVSKKYKELAYEIQKQIDIGVDASDSASLAYDIQKGKLEDLSKTEAERLVNLYKTKESQEENNRITKEKEEAVSKTIASLQDEVKALELGEVAYLAYSLQMKGASEEEIAVAVAAKQRAIAIRQAAKDQEDYVDALKVWVKEQRDAEEKMAKDRAKFSEDALERINAASSSAWVDIMNSVGDAEDGFKNAFNGIANAFKQMLAEMAHEAITKPIIMNIQQSMSGGATSAAQGGSSGASGLLSSVGAGGWYAAAAVVAVAAVNAWNQKQDEKFVKMTAEYRQGVQSTGTLLGEANRKSDSIAQSISYLGDLSGDVLNVNYGMYAALQSIDNGINGIASGFARQFGVSGYGAMNIEEYSRAGVTRLGDTRIFKELERGAAKLDIIGGELITGFAGGIMDGINKAVYSKSKKVIDSGIQFAGNTLAEILAEGTVDAFAFADVKTTKKILGVKTSVKVKTQTEELSDILLGQFADVFSGAGEALGIAADIFGLDIDKFSDKLVINAQKLSLKGLEGDELTAEIEAFFSSTLDNWAGVLVDGSDVLEKFQQIGEGAFETVIRLASELNTFNSYADALNLNFDLVGFAAVDATQAMAEFAGSFDALNAAMASYYSKFFTEEERAERQMSMLADALSELGIESIPQSNAEFRSLIESIDLATEAGQQQFASLIQYADSFAEITENVLDNAYSALQRSINAEKTLLDQQIGIINDSLSASRSVYSALESALDGMMIASSQSLALSRRQAQSSLSGMVGSARRGVLPDIESLNDALSVISRPSENLYSTFEDYAVDFYRTAADIKTLQEITGDQISVEEKTLSELESQSALLDDINTWAKDQVDIANGIDVSVKSVSDSLAALTSIIGVQYATPEQQKILSQLAVSSEATRKTNEESQKKTADTIVALQQQNKDMNDFMKSSQVAIADNAVQMKRILEKFDNIGIPLRQETVDAIVDPIVEASAP